MAGDDFHLAEGGSVTPAKSTASQGKGRERHVRVKHEGIDGETKPQDIDYSFFLAEGAALATSATVDEEGRIVFSLKSDKELPELPEDYGVSLPEFGVDTAEDATERTPPMSIVIYVVGSRGDVQPFLPVGQKLQKDGHRVRLATHGTFKDFVLEAGLEFFEIGGDPAELMSYMVKNPGILPGFESLRNGDIPKKRKMIGEILAGCWRACYEPDPISGEPFAADSIIANPPSFAHIHCAEALNVPLTIMFTMPYCATQAFPHPLVNISQSDATPGMTNYLSYVLADLLTWQGLGGIINEFRKKQLGLKPLSLRSGPLILERLRIPTIFCWSPALIPKPKDWKNHIDVTGFIFMDLGTSYQPPDDLKKFLDAGEPPIYIGFGSVPVSDPAVMTKTILEAIKKSGKRALISVGWGKLGDGIDIPESVFILGNVPHDWLFTRVSAVIHHGGAGTTAIGIKHGKPSLVVPFFGDQPFWGAMIHEADAGPEAIPHKTLTIDNLAEAIRVLTLPATLKGAARLGERVRDEDGTSGCTEAYYRHLPLLNMRCDLDETKLAVWWSPQECLKLSAFAAQVLADEKELDLSKLEPHKVKTYASRADITDPLTGGGFAIFRTVLDYHVSIGQCFINPVKGIPNAIAAIPLGIANIVSSTAEGFRNMPKLYGGGVREPGPITDLESGVKEAGKGFVMGYADAISGVFTEPVKGAQAEGPMGFVKGSARGIANAMLKPAAGGLGLVEHTSRGAWASLRKSFGPQVERISKQTATRQKQGKAAVEASSPQEREKVLAAWKVASKEKKERVATMKKEVEEWTEGMKKGGREKEVEALTEGGEPSEENVEEIEAEAPSEPKAKDSESKDKSKEIADAEKRGYERALKEAKAQLEKEQGK